MKPDPYRLIRTARLSSAKPVQHGAASGVSQHNKGKPKTPPCPACRLWNRVVGRVRKVANAGEMTEPQRDTLIATVEQVTTRIANDHPTATLTEAEQLYDEAMSKADRG